MHRAIFLGLANVALVSRQTGSRWLLSILRRHRVVASDNSRTGVPLVAPRALHVLLSRIGSVSAARRLQVSLVSSSVHRLRAASHVHIRLVDGRTLTVISPRCATFCTAQFISTIDSRGLIESARFEIRTLRGIYA